MSWSKKFTITLALSCTSLPMMIAGQPAGRDVIPVMTRYFELVAAANFEIAGDMWSAEALERSTRFGISYTDIELKTDCNSPLIRRWDEIPSQVIAPVRKYEALDDNVWYQLEYADIFGSSLLRHQYYAERRGDWFWLAYPQDFYAADWPVTESRYFRIRSTTAMQKYLNDVALDEADQFVEAMAERLGMSQASLSRIAEAKIEYFYCASDSVVEQLTGFLVRGTLDLASNDVITAEFPHFHEIFHLLINIRLKELPLYTLPVVREGLAVYLAGRWGKHPAVLMDLATALYDQDLMAFDSVFTMHGFNSESGADIVYPMTGVFCGFLVERLGMPSFLELYRRLSGKFAYLDGLDAGRIQTLIIDATGHDDWAALKADFESYMKNHTEQHLTAIPGSGNRGTRLVEDHRFVVRDRGDWIAFEFKGDPSGVDLEGNLVFAPHDELVGQVSALFESQYGESQSFEGYRFGVRFDRNEIGLYDYATNLLVAKYIWGITPSDDYYDEEKQVIGVRFRKSLFKGELPADGQWRMLPL